MQSDSFFQWLGSLIGGALRGIVAGVKSLFGGLGSALGDFSTGLAQAMGMSPSLFNLALVVLGVLLLYAAARAAMRRSFLSALVWLALAVLLLGSLTG